MTWFRNYEFSDRFIFWRSTVEREPRAAAAHNQLGLVYLQRGEISKAEDEFKKSIIYAQRPLTVVNAKVNLAGVKILKRELDEALVILKEILAINGLPPPRIYEDLGIVLMEMGKEKEALAAWRKELDFFPRSPRVYALMGLYFLKKRNWEKGKELLTLALKLEPDSPLAYYGLGKIAQERGDLQLAVSLFRRAIALKFDIAGAHYSLGRIYLSSGEYEKAKFEFEVTINLDPNFKEAYNDLAVIYASDTPPDWKKAKEYIDKARELGFPVKEGLLKIINQHQVPAFDTSS